MPYTFLPHTADVRMEVTGKTLEEVFRDALAGMMYFLKNAPIGRTDARDKNREISHHISVIARDRTALLVDFLSEILTRASIGKEVYTRVIFDILTDTDVRATVYGMPVDFFDDDIKAVTYHEAELVQGADGEWKTVVILDV